MLALIYFNWAGTTEELREWVKQAKSIIAGIDNLEFSGVFLPTSEWHYVLVLRTAAYEKVLQFIKSHVGKYGQPKTALAKIELFHTTEELGYPKVD